MPPRDNAWLSYPPTLQDYHREQEQRYADRPRGTCLGAGQCQMCGASPCVCLQLEKVPGDAVWWIGQAGRVVWLDANGHVIWGA